MVLSFRALEPPCDVFHKRQEPSILIRFYSQPVQRTSRSSHYKTQTQLNSTTVYLHVICPYFPIPFFITYLPWHDVSEVLMIVTIELKRLWICHNDQNISKYIVPISKSTKYYLNYFSFFDFFDFSCLFYFSWPRALTSKRKLKKSKK